MFWGGFIVYITVSVCILTPAVYAMPTFTDIAPTFKPTTATTTTASTTTHHPPPHNEDLPLYCSNGIGYYVERIVKADYFQALFFCKYHGLELLSVTSRDMERSLLDVFSGLEIPDDTYFLTSARSLDTSTTTEEWVWMSSGKYMKYTNWQKTTPHRNFLRDVRDDSNYCAKILYNRNSGSKINWIKTSCSDLHHFICQSGPNNDQCPDEWRSSTSTQTWSW